VGVAGAALGTALPPAWGVIRVAGWPGMRGGAVVLGRGVECLGLVRAEVGLGEV